MFYHLFYPLSADYSAFNVFRYITFRSIFAFMLAALVSIIWGKKFIQFMRNKQFGQIISSISKEIPNRNLIIKPE